MGKVVPIRGNSRDESTVLETIEMIATTFSVAGLQYNNWLFGDRNRSVLGMDFLKAHKKVVFDFPNGYLYLVPPGARESEAIPLEVKTGEKRSGHH